MNGSGENKIKKVKIKLLTIPDLSRTAIPKEKKETEDTIQYM